MTKQEYREYLDKIDSIFIGDMNYMDCTDAIGEGSSTFKISQNYLKKVFERDWIDIIEEILPSIDTIVRNPRKFITVEEDIIDISLAKQISVESVKHLAQHTQYIAAVDEKNDTVTPSKILNTSKEESFEVYENRFIYTLILRLDKFVDTRYDLIEKSVIKDNRVYTVNVDSNYDYKGAKMSVKLEATAEIPYDEKRFTESSDYGQLIRVKKIRGIIKGFLNSAFAKEMRSCALVRPPITRTNVIKKEPNFKKALILWQFIESYEKEGFETKKIDMTTNLPDELNEHYLEMLFVNNIILNNFANFNEEQEALDEAEARIDRLLRQKGQSGQDDFPNINMELREVRKVYHRMISDKTYTKREYRTFTSALDRVINRKQLLDAERDKKLKAKLIEKQKKEEARLRALQKKEDKLEENRIKKEEELMINLLVKEHKEKLRLEKEKELEEARIKKLEEKKILERLLEEQQRNFRIDEFRKNLEIQMKQDIEEYQKELELTGRMDLNNQEFTLNREINKYKREMVAEFEKFLDSQLEDIHEENKEQRGEDIIEITEKVEG